VRVINAHDRLRLRLLLVRMSPPRVSLKTSALHGAPLARSYPYTSGKNDKVGSCDALKQKTVVAKVTAAVSLPFLSLYYHSLNMLCSVVC
jgi:hypothetical protein